MSRSYERKMPLKYQHLNCIVLIHLYSTSHSAHQPETPLVRKMEGKKESWENEKRHIKILRMSTLSSQSTLPNFPSHFQTNKIMYAHVCTYVCIYIGGGIYVCICVYMYVSMRICTCTYICMYIWMYVYM